MENFQRFSCIFQWRYLNYLNIQERSQIYISFFLRVYDFSPDFAFMNIFMQKHYNFKF